MVACDVVSQVVKNGRRRRRRQQRLANHRQHW